MYKILSLNVINSDSVSVFMSRLSSSWVGGFVMQVMLTTCMIDALLLAMTTEISNCLICGRWPCDGKPTSRTGYIQLLLTYLVPSVLWHCWLGGRKGTRPVKKLEWWGAGVVICLVRGADLHMAQLMPLPLTVSCSSKIQIGFTFLVPAHSGSPGQRADKRMYVCVCYLLTHVHITNKYKHV